MVSPTSSVRSSDTFVTVNNQTDPLVRSVQSVASTTLGFTPLLSQTPSDSRVSSVASEPFVSPPEPLEQGKEAFIGKNFGRALGFFEQAYEKNQSTYLKLLNRLASSASMGIQWGLTGLINDLGMFFVGKEMEFFRLNGEEADESQEYQNGYHLIHFANTMDCTRLVSDLSAMKDGPRFWSSRALSGAILLLRANNYQDAVDYLGGLVDRPNLSKLEIAYLRCLLALAYVGTRDCIQAIHELDLVRDVIEI